jgi:hypothetical protein
MMRKRAAWSAIAVFVATCKGDGRGTGVSGGNDESGDSSGEESASASETQTDGSETGTEDGMPRFDVGEQDGTGETDTGQPPSCKVVDEMDGVPPCETIAPPDSFEPDVQWAFTPDTNEKSSAVTPLVANLTDDNDDGEVDLCDVPDVVIVAYWGGGEVTEPGHIYVLDGETGALHYQVATNVVRSVDPVIADLDADGFPEIVSVRKIPDQLPAGPLVAFDGRDGSMKWEGSPSWYLQYGSALAIANLDAAGGAEIYGGSSVADDVGVQQWTGLDVGAYAASTAADLDDDGDLEIVLANRAYHHDGTIAWTNDAVEAQGYPQVADLDGEPGPEVLVTTSQGLSVLESDGTSKYLDLRPTGIPAGGNNWRRPATVHDFDGDGAAEYAMSSQLFYTMYEADGTIGWSADVLDASGVAAGTAFDFLGDGGAEAMYADETNMFVFDDAGGILLMTPRKSWTGIEYPVVADVDNDGSAEILVVSNDAWSGMNTAPTVQVIRDIEDRWVPTRRIWNQHTYHVTNVREDGIVPDVEPKSWTLLNTFRTNVQAEGGGICKPEPEG